MTTGIRRYFNLWHHIANPTEYILNKGRRHRRDLVFTTRPRPITFSVSASLYLVFKEIFMADVYAIDTLVSQLPALPVVIDVGANAGFFSIQLLSKLPEATIYAYEPIPANVQTFRQTIAQNPQIGPNVNLHEMAVTGKPLAELILFAEAEPNSQVVASQFAGFNDNNTHPITVPCITLTDIIEGNNLQTIDLLKVDCEGSEYDILYNTAPDLIRRVARLSVEVHDLDDQQNNIRAFEPYLQSLGFTTIHQPINSFCHALEAVRQ